MDEFDWNNIIDNFDFTLITALIGAIGTTISWIRSFIQSRRKLDMKLHELSQNEKGILIFASFVNRSSLPITILSLSIKNGDIYYPACMNREIANQRVRKIGNNIVDTYTEYTLQFPIDLVGKSSTSGYFYFPNVPDTSSTLTKIAVFQICTTRGKAIEKKLSLDSCREC